MDVFLGYDPGGDGNHGVAAVFVNDRTASVARVAAATEATAASALARLSSWGTEHKLRGLGVDTLTEWSLDSAGWRAADLWLRQQYPAVHRSVSSPNTLRGAMALSGMGVVIELRANHPNLVVTEAHPKAVCFACTNRMHNSLGIAGLHSWMQSALAASVPHHLDEHALDALISAWSCWQGVRGTWTRDLHALAATTLAPARSYPPVRPAGPTNYFWPSS